MDEKMFSLYNEIQAEISKFTKRKRQMENPQAIIGAEGIIRGLEIALSLIIESDKK